MKLIMENWRNFIDEDAEKRKQFAQSVRDSPEWDSEYRQDRPGFDEKERTAAYKGMAKAGRSLKQVFAKHADREFLDSLTTVHWGHQKDILDLMKKGSSRDELSANAFLPGQFHFGEWQFGGDYGLVVKGHITLLANDMDDLSTGSGWEYAEADPERAKMSGANKGVSRLYHPDTYESGGDVASRESPIGEPRNVAAPPVMVLDKEDWQPRKGKSGSAWNEALVDNWRIVGIILSDPKADKPSRQGTRHNWEKYAEAVGLDVPVMTAKEAVGQL